MKAQFTIFLAILCVVLTVAMQCPTENGIRDREEFIIYGDILTQNFDIGVEDALKKRDWIEAKDDYLQMNYPGNMEWGTVFIVAGAVPFTTVSENFSDYKTLAVDLKGEKDGQCLMISIADIDSSICKPQYATDLSTGWQTYYFSLENFGQLSLDRLHVVAQFSFGGKTEQTVCLRNIRYLKEEIPATTDQPFHIFVCNMLTPGFDIGIAIDSLSTSPDSIEVDIDNSQMKIEYPGDHDWGCVFIYDKQIQPHEFSMYKNLAFEIKGELGSEIVYIGIRDTSNFPNDVKRSLQNEWEYVEIPLKTYRFVDFEQLFILFCITFRDQDATTVYVRNIKYLL